MTHKFGARSSNAARVIPSQNRRKFARKIIKVAAIWPVTVQDFQNTKWPAVRYFFQ